MKTNLAKKSHATVPLNNKILATIKYRWPQNISDDKIVQLVQF